MKVVSWNMNKRRKGNWEWVIENLDPECDLDVTPNSGKSRELRTAMSNAFGFGGTNASIIFQKTD